MTVTVGSVNDAPSSVLSSPACITIAVAAPSNDRAEGLEAYAAGSQIHTQGGSGLFPVRGSLLRYSLEWVDNFDAVELKEIRVGGVDSADTVLKHQDE